MFQHGLNRRGHDLAEAADRGKAHGLREFVEEREIGAILRFGYAALRPAHEHIGHFLRTYGAGNTLAAGLIAIKAAGIEGHVQHASGVIADDDGAGTEHGAGFGEGFEIEANIDHGSGKIAGRRAGWREGFQLSAAAKAARMIEDNVAHGRAHGYFENAGAGNVAADTDKFQSARATGALSDEPIDAARENLRNVDEGFDVVDDGRFLPEADLARKGRLVARLGAMAFDGFDERAFFATDVAAGADKNFQSKIEIAPEDFFAKKPGAITPANFFTENLFLKMVLVADIRDAALRSGDQAGDDHALDEEMRQVSHDEAVLDGAGLAFIGVADNIFHGIRLLADEIPFHAGGKSGAAHAFQLGGFELREYVVPGLGLNELANNAVLFAFAIGIGFPIDPCLLRPRFCNIVPPDAVPA